MKDKLVVILGPTATGKSKSGILLAKKLQTKIISGDSMLVYKGFDIGTAKPTKEEMQGIEHYLVDNVLSTDKFNTVDFQQYASQYIKDMNKENKIPLLVGGTGLYIKSLIEGYQFSNVEENSELRLELEKFASDCGNEALHAKLKELAPDMAEHVHPNNRQRLIRAMELAKSGETMVPQEKEKELMYDSVIFGLQMDRDLLYKRINERVRKMFEGGIIQEVETLLNSGISPDTTAMQGIGYKEIVEYLNGNFSLDECVDIVARNTRRFAKRQITWYKKMPYVIWYDISEYTSYEDITNDMFIKVEEKFNLQ